MPLALLGLLALPALAAIYLFHRRSRLHTVSSLLLWSDPRIASDGGRRIERLRLPLLFWLELLAILALVLAAAGPYLPAHTRARPLVVVLDDSFSMQAGGADSPRNRAGRALVDDLRPNERTRLILAGDRPRILGDFADRAAGIEPLLEGWTCRSATARLDAAIALAREIGGPESGIVVLTDRAPELPPTDGRLRWWAFGTPRPNWAIVSASRAAGPRGDRILLEVANLADEPHSTTLRLESLDSTKELKRSELRLGPGETHRLVVEMPDVAVRAAVTGDDLPFDDQVVLVPSIRKSVLCDVRVGEAKLQAALERAVKGSGSGTADTGAHLVFLSGEAAAPDSDEAWVVRFLSEPEAEAYTGPFVLDRAHPLLDGVSLAGVIWGGGTTPLPGQPVVMAGNVPLVADSVSSAGRHEVRIRLRHDISTLTESPAWPVLIWNLVHWRAAHLPGLDRANVRLGEAVLWSLGGKADQATVKRPDGAAIVLPVRDRQVAIRAEQPGLHLLQADFEAAQFAANPLDRDESDLARAATGRWGDDHDETSLRLDYRDVRWPLAILAAAAATLHLWFASRRTKGNRP